MLPPPPASPFIISSSVRVLGLIKSCLGAKDRTGRMVCKSARVPRIWKPELILLMPAFHINQQTVRLHGQQGQGMQPSSAVERGQLILTGGEHRGPAGWDRAAEEEGSCLSVNHDGFSGLQVMVVDLRLCQVLLSLGKHPGGSLSLKRKLPRCSPLQRAISHKC